MKILKWLLLVILALIVLLFAGGTLISPKFTVSRSIVIHANPDKVYPLVADPRRWKEWSIWNRRDPAMAIEFSGAESGAGAVWSWKSKSEGDGRMTFTAAEPGRRVAYELFFPDFGTTSTGDVALASSGSDTQVTWTIHGDMGSNPFFRWLALNADGMVGPDFEAGLAGLKTLAEQ